MTDPINDGGPAFPTQPFTGPGGDFEWRQSGMSLRDFFATTASEKDIESRLQGPVVPQVVGDVYGNKRFVRMPRARSREQARFLYADDMLKARGY